MTPAPAAAACERLAVAYRLWAMPSSPPHSSTADRDLVARAAGGDERAMAGLYDRYGQVLYAVAYRIVGERADAEEVVLDAFAQAWRDAPRFEAARGSVAGWLTMIARSRALDLVRARSRRDRITTAAASARPDAPLAMGEVRPDPPPEWITPSGGGRCGRRWRRCRAPAPGDRAGLLRRAVAIRDRRAAAGAARNHQDADPSGHAEAA